MSTALNEQDLILLNAYLDDELSTGEKEAFEQRLILEPALQAELESLRVTVAMLQMAERVPVPRNFTLDPVQYAPPEKAGLLARLGLGGIPRLVTAGAALLVVFVCVGVMIMGGGLGGGMNDASSVAEEPMFAVEQAAPAEELGAAPVEAPDGERSAEQQTGEPIPDALAPQAAAEEEEPVEELPEAAVVEEGAAAAAVAEDSANEEPAEEEAMAEEFVQMPSELPPGTGTGMGGGFGGGAGNGEEAQAAALPTQTIPTYSPTPAPQATLPPASTMVAEAPDQDDGAQESQDTYADEAGETAKAFDAQPAEQPPAEPVAATEATSEEPILPNWAIGLAAVIGLLVVLLVSLSIVILVRRRSS